MRFFIAIKHLFYSHKVFVRILFFVFFLLWIILP